MKQINLFFKTLLILCALVWSGSSAWAQSDLSANHAGNITLSTSGGSNAQACKVKINSTDEGYDGIKAGTSNKVGAVKITVPKGAKYLHLHAAGWSGNTAVALAVTPTGYSNNISLTNDGGITGNSPFTLSSASKATTDYYKVITFSSPLAANTDLTFTASGGKRFVIWGVSSEAASTDEATTVTIDASGITNTDIANGTAAGSLSAVVKDASSNTIDGASVTWSSSNTNVATIDATGAVTLENKGTTTLKATYAGVDGTYQSSNATYELTVVDTKIYSVSEARAIIDGSNEAAKNNIYVQGRISKIDQVNTDAGKKYATYRISVDGKTSSDQLMVIQGKYVDNADFTSQDQIEVGDIVVILGNLKKDGSTYEFVAGNYIVTRTPDSRIASSLTWSASEVEIDKGAADDTYTLPTLSNPQKVSPIVYTITGTDNLAVEVDGEILVDTDVEGSVTVTAAFEGNDDYRPAAASYTITVIDRNKKGTIYNPYTVADVKNGTATGSGIYVIGYIVGSYDATTPNNPATVDTNLALADAATETNGANTIPVQLPKGNLRDIWGPKTNKVIGYRVILKGNKDTYFSVNGLTGTTEISAVSIPVTISSVGLATFASDEALDFTNVEDLEAYVAKANGSKATLEKVNKVPANTGMLLRALNDKTAFDVPVTTTATALSFNNLFVRGTGVAVASTDGDYTNYVLGKKKSGDVGFFKANGKVVSANQAYLHINTSLGAPVLTFDDLTGIAIINEDMPAANNGIFDLQGRRVAEPTKGFYIKNGKKVVVK